MKQFLQLYQCGIGYGLLYTYLWWPTFLALTFITSRSRGVQGFRQSCLDRRHENNSWSACLWTSINLIKQTYITCVWETTEIDSQNNWGWTWWWLVFLTQLLSNQINLIHGLRIDWEKLCCKDRLRKALLPAMFFLQLLYFVLVNPQTANGGLRGPGTH